MSRTITIDEHTEGVTVQIIYDSACVEYEFDNLSETLEALPNLEELSTEQN